jgi:hypothetical protein
MDTMSSRFLTLEEFTPFVMLHCYEVDRDLAGDQKLWRYMDLAKFVSMLCTKSLWLARADTFRDRWEGRFPDEMRELLERAYETFDKDDESPIKNVDDFQDYVVKNTFVSCWHKNFEENFVMWELYGGNNNGVAIQTTLTRLRDSIDKYSVSGYSLLLKNVTYKNAKEISGELPYENCIFIKRPHFVFEEEFRISLDTYDPAHPSRKTEYGQELLIDLNGLIE